MIATLVGGVVGGGSAVIGTVSAFKALRQSRKTKTKE